MSEGGLVAQTTRVVAGRHEQRPGSVGAHPKAGHHGRGGGLHQDHTGLLVLGGLLLLLLLVLLRRWLFVWLVLYLVVLIFLGLLGLAGSSQGILRKMWAKAFGDPKGTGSEGQPRIMGATCLRLCLGGDGRDQRLGKCAALRRGWP